MEEVSHRDLGSTLDRYQLTEEDVVKQVSDLHLQDIVRSKAIEWECLPVRLGMENPTTVVKDIKDEVQDSPKRRAEFFSRWQKEKGTGASYKSLVNALLRINCKLDAEYVCQLAASKESGTLYSYRGNVSSM